MEQGLQVALRARALPPFSARKAGGLCNCVAPVATAPATTTLVLEPQQPSKSYGCQGLQHSELFLYWGRAPVQEQHANLL